MRNAAIAIFAALMLLPGLIPAPSGAQASEGGFEFDRYHGYAEIKAELERVSAEYPGITDLMLLGKTWESRDLMAMRVTDNPELEEAEEPDILIMGGHHANELPSVEVPMFILKHILENYETDSGIRSLVDSNDIWFVPLVNPDGREYSMSTDPAWRKNRRPTDGGVGVDLNRNYGHLWGQQPGANHDPASSTYCGPSAFSENETMAIKNLAETVGFSISLSYHTYGQVIYYPWNNGIDTASPSGHILEAIAKDLGRFTGYTPMQGIDAYPTTGDSDDWLYADAGCLPFTIELGTQFVPPPDQLESLCRKNLGAALHAIGLAAEPESALLPDWTVMTYVSSDADIGLANEAFIDINEMESAGSTDDVKIIALYDGMATGDSKLYRIEKDPGGVNAGIISSILDDGGAIIPATDELDMSDPVVLRNFVNWTMANYPARQYLLSFWGHGDGVLEDFVPDKGNGLMISDLELALGEFHIDVIGFDTCSMGHFEVAMELMDIADIMIGSEAEEPLAGWDYSASMVKLVLEPWMAPDRLASIIVSDYLASNTVGYLTQAAIDLRVFRDRFVPALEEFISVSLDFAYDDYAETWFARNATDTFLDTRDTVDLFEFLIYLEPMSVSAPVQNRTARLLDMMDELVIFSGSGYSFPKARSMAVYFPLLMDPVSPHYSGLRFLDTGWLQYLEGMRNPAPRPFIRSTTPGTVNNTFGPYRVTAEIINGPEFPDILLMYRVNGGAWRLNNMGAQNGTLESDPFKAISGQPNGTVIEYFFDDVASNITEPYDVKWGGEVYLTITVFAECDVSLAWESFPDASNLTEGNATNFRLNAANLGPEPVTFNVTLTANRTASNLIIGWKVLTLQQGQHSIVEFNWTAQPGNWTINARASQSLVYDTDTNNQEVTSSLDVRAVNPPTPQEGWWSQYFGLVLVLTILWAAAIAVIISIIRKGRMRRTRAAARSIAAAKDFLATAEEFGADTITARALLVSAESALARNALPECENLVRRSREVAMDSVGGRNETQK